MVSRNHTYSVHGFQNDSNKIDRSCLVGTVLQTVLPLISSLYQASFDLVKDEPTPVLALHNLWRQIHMFQDIQEFRVENSKKYWGKTVWSHICGKMALNIHKITYTNRFLTLGPSWGKFWLLRTLWRNLDMFLDILKLQVEKNA